MAKLSKKETVNIPANESMQELLQRIASMPDMGNEFTKSLGYERVEPEPERGKGIFGQPVQVPVTWGTGTAPAYTRYQPTVESTVGGELLTGSLPFMVTTPLFGLPQLAGFLAVDNFPKIFKGNSITGSVGNLTEKAYDLLQKDPEKQAKYGPVFNDLGVLAGGIGVGAAESAYARGVLDRAAEYALRAGDNATKEMKSVWKGEESGFTAHKLNNKWDFIKHALFNKGKTGTPFQQDNMYYTGKQLLNDIVYIDGKPVISPKYKSGERSFDIIDEYVGRREGQLDPRYYVPASLDDLPANALKRIEEGLWPGAKPKVYKIADNFTDDYSKRNFAKDFARMPDTVQPSSGFVTSTSGTDLYDPGHMVRYPMTDPLTGQHFYRAFDIQKYGNSKKLNDALHEFLEQEVPTYVQEKISKLSTEWMRKTADKIVEKPLDYLAKPETAANFTNWIDRKHNPFVMYWDEPIDEAEYIAELGRLANGAKSAAKNTGIDLTKSSSGSVSKGLAADFVGTAKYLGLPDDVIKNTLDTASDSEITKIMDAWDGLKADFDKAGIDIKDKLQNFDWGDFELTAIPKAKEDLHTTLKTYEELTQADQNLIETLKESNNIIENPTISDLSALKQQIEYTNKTDIQKKYNIPKEDVNINFNLDDLVSKITKPTESELEAAQNLLSDHFAKTLAGLKEYSPTSIKFYTSVLPTDAKLKVLNLISDGNKKEAINLLHGYLEKELPFACGGHINRYASGGTKNRINQNTDAVLQESEHPVIDFSGIKTTNNRKYNPEYISYINNALDNANVSNTKKAAILANIIEESGGNPFGLDKTGNFYGLLQWGNDRYAPTEEKDIYSEIDNQTKYLLNTLGNKTDSVSWTHGGKGTGYQSFEDAMRDFDSDDLATAMRGFTLGYVRPAGKLDSLANRMKVAQQIYDMFNSTSGAKVDKAINMISPVVERNPGFVRRLIESAKRKNSGGFR